MASVVISGDTSGTVTLAAPDVAGSTTLTLPTTNGELGLAKTRFVSTAQTITSGGLLTIPHGLGAKPYNIMPSVVCITASSGYSVGDEIIMPPSISISGAAYGLALWVDATNIYIRFGNVASTALVSAVKGTGAYALLVNTAWQLYVRAEL